LQQLLQLAVGFDAAVTEVGIAQGQVAGEHHAPVFDLLQEGGIDGGGAAFGLVGLGELIERSFEDGLAGEGAGDVVPVVGIIFIAQIQDAGDAGLVGVGRFDAAIVDSELLEVGEDRQREFAGPGVAAQRIGGGDRP
jgi:hypothetical protein